MPPKHFQSEIKFKGWNTLIQQCNSLINVLRWSACLTCSIILLFGCKLVTMKAAAHESHHFLYLSNHSVTPCAHVWRGCYLCSNRKQLPLEWDILSQDESTQNNCYWFRGQEDPDNTITIPTQLNRIRLGRRLYEVNDIPCHSYAQKVLMR